MTPKPKPTQKTRGPEPELINVRTSLEPRALARAFQDNLHCLLGRFPAVASTNDNYLALAYTVRDRLLSRWIQTAQAYRESLSRTICYLSAEFLMGPQLGNNLVNLGIRPQVEEAMKSLGLDLEPLLDHEEEPGLGNGGLGRLAACYLDSMATLQIPSIGYGIRYEFGIFDQEIHDGWQTEVTDKWLRLGNPWEVPRPEIVHNVKFGGHTEVHNEDGIHRVRWIPGHVVHGMAYDSPVVGYRVNTVNLLRLWKAAAVESFDFQAFNTGNYYEAVMEKVVSENITKVLYPNDGSPQGKELRLQQQYFFASCALQDMIRIHLQKRSSLDDFHNKFVVQLNDTHPAIAVAELMRLLVDEHRMPWDRAWEVTRKTFAYTNHTLLPEALERWAVPLFAKLLPRHLEIIYEINHRFLLQVQSRFPNDPARLSRMSLIEESGERSIRMAHLASVGSFAVNGVAKLHSELLVKGVLRDFAEFNPTQFQNKTNGVTPRRFLLLSNPSLADLITSRIGNDWTRNLDELRKLVPFAEDEKFRDEWRRVKRKNKDRLADLIRQRTGIETDPESIFDVQVKRLHEYKRQHLNALHIITLYNRLRRDPDITLTPRTFVFGGKAAPGYYMAKLIIKLINSIADIVNQDPIVGGRLKVAFIPNFNVKTAQTVYPGADLSEQISTAGKEASGTGNMKFAMNGAVTIGTLDGANIEIREAVGADNFFLFGMDEEEVRRSRQRGYHPREFYDARPDLRAALDQIRDGFFSPRAPGLFRPLIDSLLNHDDYFVLADYGAYIDAQEAVAAAFRDVEQWTRMSILNTAGMGFFSSDRSIHDYCTDIWKIRPVPIKNQIGGVSP